MRYMVKSNKYGRVGSSQLLEARRVEWLANGKWLVTYVSGLTELFDREPTYTLYHPYREQVQFERR